jgi:UDPglucose--hexose-1-phosphate uridylyltransferase
MSELRQNAATRDWIVIATERAKRPDQFRNTHRRRELPPQDPSCPFCPGNEELTPFETYGVRDTEGRWLVRSVPNKFAAFTLRGSRERHTQGLLRSMDGVGAHEVIIESPRHDQTIGTLPCSQLELVLNCYRERFCALLEDPRIELVTIFRNHGEQAGTSLIHPHSQLIATPVVPPFVRERMDTARHYYDQWGGCLYCDMIAQELAEGARLITQNDHFICFAPHASRQPFEMWVLPRRHHSSFGAISLDEVKGLACVLGEALARLYVGLADPDYNYMIHTAPYAELDVRHYHWHLQVLPRLSTPAGFELGSGIYISTAYPEQSAGFLRGVVLPPELPPQAV